jgi:hypothetical protein
VVPLIRKGIKMGTVRDFVCEYDLPYDPIVEMCGYFYLDTGDLMNEPFTFIKFYNRAVRNVDEHAYKGVVLEYEKDRKN